MTEDEIIRFAADLPGVVASTASQATGAPEMAWGDSFFVYAPSGEPGRQQPFATIVIKDYDGFDESSNVNRPGVFRLNVGVGRRRCEQLLGYPPAAYPTYAAGTDHAVLDAVIPHPAYATQGWVSILCPGPATSDEARSLITHAYERAVARHRAPPA